MKSMLNALAIIFFIIVVCNGFAYADLSDGLVAYYPFSGNANDASGNGNHGVVTGASLVEDRMGNSNSAYEFDNDVITIENNENFNSPQITISAWVKVKTYSNHGRIVAKYVWSPRTGYKLVVPDSGYPYAGYGHGGSSETALGAKSKIPLHEWHFLTTTYDGNTFKIFFDGNLERSVDQTTPIASNTIPLTIGRNNEGSFVFYGVIDEVRIYNRAISESEVKALYNYNNNSANCNDSDRDGVADQWDTCPDTPTDSWVNKNGCPASGLYTEEQMNQMVQSILTWGDINGDKKIDLSEAVHALRVTSGVTEPALK